MSLYKVYNIISIFSENLFVIHLAYYQRLHGNLLAKTLGRFFFALVSILLKHIYLSIITQYGTGSFGPCIENTWHGATAKYDHKEPKE